MLINNSDVLDLDEYFLCDDNDMCLFLWSKSIIHVSHKMHRGKLTWLFLKNDELQEYLNEWSDKNV